MIWHSSDITDILNTLGANEENGFTEEQAEQKLTEFGMNQLVEKKPGNFLQRFFDQMKDFMVIVLLIAAAISAGITVYNGEYDWAEPIVIIAIVLINALLGVVQESKAEAALEALKNMSAPKSRVLRGGKTVFVPTQEIVPGDILMLEAGDFIPADARLISSAGLRCDESALTGESVTADKYADAQVREISALGDRSNMVYSGCIVAYGHAKAVVTETGMNTEMGKVAALLNSGEQPITPLQVKLQKLGKTLGVLALVICVVIFIIGIITNLGFMNMLVTAISLAVAAIPEGLPAIVTITLALGVQRMVKRNAIIRSLPAVETLGSANVICSDKTGTLTLNRMTMMEAWVAGEPFDVDKGRIGEAPEEISNLLRMAALCCDAKAENQNGKTVLIGDPTETALVAAAGKYGMEKNDLENFYPRVSEIPFDSERKLMTTVHIIEGRPVAIVKGAPDILFSKCVDGNIEQAKKINDLFANKALRVLAIAYKPLNAIPTNPVPEELENMLTLVGMVGLIDPPREEAKQAIKKCKTAGIKTVMITGDHVLTACAIAKELGIFEEGDRAVTGVELSRMNEEELNERIEHISVYARVSPEDKIRIVRAWQKKGKVVSMTGDGVNDAPALRAADIGCAMGVTGTDVAKGAAAMVLTDDNFATIVGAVEEGRGIYDNIRKAVRFLLGCNLGELLAVLGSIIMGWGAPLVAIQLLWINLVTDSLPALALGMEKPEKDIMNRPPRKRDESVLADNLGLKAILEGVMFAVLTLTAYYLGRFVFTDNVEIYGQTMAFAVLAFSQLVHASNVRSSHSLFRAGVNPYMLGAFGISALLMLAVLLTPLHEIFKLTPLNSAETGWVIALSFTPFVIEELVKLFFNLKNHFSAPKSQTEALPQEDAAAENEQTEDAEKPQTEEPQEEQPQAAEEPTEAPEEQ